MTALVTPHRLADAVLRRLEKSACRVNAYWIGVSEDRNEYAATLTGELRDEPVVVVIVREARFTNPNALLADFIELVERNQDLCEERLDPSDPKYAFVLLSRSELGMPHISSPVVLPPWFPIDGGTSVSMVIEDLTWRADAPFGAAEVKVGELCEDLLELEQTLLTRISEVRAQDHDRRKTMSFLDLVRREKGEKLEGILQAASQHRASITTPSAFRPSLRDARSLIARLWGVAQESQPERLTAPSKALAAALDLPEEFDRDWHESLASVLRRPSAGEGAVRLRFARNILLTVGTACQLITAAAHSDAYEHYPVSLLQSFSYDIRRSLVDAEAVVSALAD